MEEKYPCRRCKKTYSSSSPTTYIQYVDGMAQNICWRCYHAIGIKRVVRAIGIRWLNLLLACIYPFLILIYWSHGSRSEVIIFATLFLIWLFGFPSLLYRKKENK